ncbi:MAG: hypothetical protein HDR25_06950 [Lachnospiraceae bacterium]|nr:hypothetical protein [Lachnospiraceae bacterium]
MKERAIEKRLREYAAVCEQILPEEKEERIRALLEIASKSRTRGTLWDFILEQIGYLGRYCLIWQALWIVLFWYLMRHGESWLSGVEGNGAFVLLSLMPPILVLLTVEEITKVYQRSMLEIEYATKYSLQGVIMTRMSVLCVFHSMILLGCILALRAHLDSEIGKLLVYGFTPMFLITGVLLKLMQHCQGELLRNAVIGVYGLAVVLALVGNTRYFGLFQPNYFRIWCVVCAVGIVFGIRQFVCLHHKLSGFEQIA